MPDNFKGKTAEEKVEPEEESVKSSKNSKGRGCLFFLFLVLVLFFWGRRFLKGLPQIREDNGRVNLVLLGISGDGQKPADLTDTIIFSSFNKSNGRTLFLSLPRDIWSDSLKSKINTAYHYGGFSLARQSLEEVIGQPVHYLFVLDFEGFKKVVDFLGGIDIYIERTFTDFKYPVPGKEDDLCDGDKELKCRYEELHFEKGWEKMDGERALKFVRSRNAEGEEGTDFARNQRQQKFLLALKDKALQPKNIFRLKKAIKLLPSLIKTDLKQEEYPNFGLIFLKFQSDKIKTEQLKTEGEEALLFHPLRHSSGQWVLLPKDGNGEEIKSFVKINLP